MIRERIEADDSDLGFEFFLAERLHMTVARMRQEMSSAEYAHWAVWYGIKAQRAELQAQLAGGG